MKNNATVFLIDDDADDREIFSLALAEIDPAYTCITAKNGIDALERLSTAEIKPDYIFLDLNMPRMNGKQCLEEIKKQTSLARIPVVIYTTSSGSWEKEQLLQMGASAFITKPSEIDQLIHSLKEIFIDLK